MHMKLALWCSGQSHHLCRWHPIWDVLVVLLPIKLLANSFRKAEEYDPSVWETGSPGLFTQEVNQ